MAIAAYAKRNLQCSRHINARPYFLLVCQPNCVPFDGENTVRRRAFDCRHTVTFVTLSRFGVCLEFRASYKSCKWVTPTTFGHLRILPNTANDFFILTHMGVSMYTAQFHVKLWWSRPSSSAALEFWRRLCLRAALESSFLFGGNMHRAAHCGNFD